MIRKTMLAMLCISLLIYGPAAEAAATSATSMLGQIAIRGNAKVNGITTPSGTTIFSGDQIGTEANSIAEMLLKGGSKVVLPESSVVVLSNDATQAIVDLKQGALAVLSKSPSPALIEANGARIRPAADVAVVLEVAIHGNSLKVVARRGSAIIETADKTLEVEEGKELDATMAGPAPQGPAGAQPPRRAARGKLETYVFITAVGAGLTGLVLGIIAISRPNPADCTVVSPSGPGSLKCP